MLDTDIDFNTMYSKGDVVAKDGYHQPDKEQRCKCDNTTKKGAYKEVVIEYEGKKYFYLHQNPIMVKMSPSKFVVSSAGHKTELTKRTLNRILPSKFKIIQRDKEWYIEIGEERKEFKDGMVVTIE